MNVTEIRRPANMERITTPELAQTFIEEQIALIKEQTGRRQEGTSCTFWRSGFLSCCCTFNQSHRSAVSMCPCESWSAS